MTGHPPASKYQLALQLVVLGVFGVLTVPGWAQGPTPETGNTIFPGGGLASYAADFFSRRPPGGVTSIRPTILPTRAVSQPLQLSWGVRRDLELTAVTSIDTNRLNLSAAEIQKQVRGAGTRMEANRKQISRGVTQIGSACRELRSKHHGRLRGASF